MTYTYTNLADEFIDSWQRRDDRTPFDACELCSIMIFADWLETRLGVLRHPSETAASTKRSPSSKNST